jgi:hypothetical protein
VSAVTTPQEAVPKKEETPETIKLLGLLPFMVLGMFTSAAVFLLLWRWFVVPLGVRDITYWHSMGILLVASYVKFNASENRDGQGAQYWRRILRRSWCYLVFFLVVGWLVHLAAG